MNYWLFKSEPDAFGIDDLKACPGKRDSWDGIRNYQARNLMRDAMKKGDMGFFYHSSCAVPAVVGIVEVVREAYPDHTALDPAEKYYDAKSSADNQRWCMVDVKYRRMLKKAVPLATMKAEPRLADMALLRRGNRLSIQPVTEAEWQVVLELGGR